jgi:hypothetical protein
MSNTTIFRGGNTLVITLMMIVLVVGLVSLATDHLSANRALAQVDREHQRAQFAAESFIALVERKLYNRAADNTETLKDNLDATWFGLVGLDTGISGSATTAIYLDNCALRWRVEPIRIMTRTQTPADADEKFFVNSERNPELQFERRQAAGENLIDDEAQHFYFSIAVEAYALKKPGDVTSIPWRDRGTHHAMAQAQRVVQFEDVNAFRYLFNYVANSNAGDLEFTPSTSVSIKGGGLRSNQRIFLSAAGAAFAIGTSVDPVPVEAADGIFAINKGEMLVDNQTDALLVATTGGTPNDTSGNVTLNGVALQHTGDSRTSLNDANDPTRNHHEAVRDGSTDRPVQEDLTTYQGWNNGFLMPTWTRGPGTPIYKYTAPTGDFYSIRAKDTVHGLPTPTLTTYYATGLPLFRFPVSTDPQNSNTFSDIWPFPPGEAGVAYGLRFPANILSPGPGEVELVHPDSGLPKPPAPLKQWVAPPAIQDEPENTYPFPDARGLFAQSFGTWSRGRTGLVIRERGRQLGTATPNPGPLDLEALNTWMKANYVVYLGRGDPLGGTEYQTIDITDEFFAYSISTAPTTVRDLMAHEDVFTNRREQAWFASQGLPNTQANVLTLNLTRVANFLNEPVSTTAAGLDPGRYYRDYFNDLIYVERTPRPFKDAAAQPYAHPLVPAMFNPFGALSLSLNDVPGLAQPMLSPIIGFVDTGAVPGTVHGTAGTWAVYPHTRGVRLDRATNAAKRRLTIVTPNTCYLWGDFNTSGTTPTPCAVYADAVIALSNAWEDAASADTMLPVATKTVYRAAFVTHNVPTDTENDSQGGSGGAHNLIRFLEDWSGVNFSLTGCVVVPGRMRHTRAPIGIGFHEEPNYLYTFNQALLTSGGQPPASIKTTQAKRVMSSVIGAPR